MTVVRRVPSGPRREVECEQHVADEQQPVERAQDLNPDELVVAMLDVGR